MESNVHTFYADAVLFDMDGTLTDSIAAVEAAWTKVAKDVGQDPAYVIAATHGKRAADNLAQFKPHIQPHEMPAHVRAFEESILFFADAFQNRSARGDEDETGVRGADPTAPAVGRAHHHAPVVGAASSGEATPELVASSPTSSLPSSRASSFVALGGRRPSFAARLYGMLAMSSVPESEPSIYDPRRSIVEEEGEDGDEDDDVLTFDPSAKKHALEPEPWQIEAASVDRSVRILPGVRNMLDSIPEGLYAVATSGAKTYAYGCMQRVGIVPPAVTVTADDPRVTAGKPSPDPFLVAARDLGFPASRCVVFEDSPSGIRAGLASGATVIAVCTSHARAQVEREGAHYVVENMKSVSCERCEDGSRRLRFTVRL